MKFGFVTCVEIGLSCMNAIYEVGGDLDLIISLPDEKAKKKSGRIYVDEFANKHQIPILKTNHINDEKAIKIIKEKKIDWLFIIGWSQIASKEVIDAPKLGVIGAHPTLLPVGRGRAAIPWAIIKGLDETGVSFFKMDEGVDTGLILGQEIVPVLKEETASSLYKKVNKAHEILIKKTFFDLKENKVIAYKQDESKATYWEGRKPKDGEINTKITVIDVDRLVRATTKPYPGAFIKIDSKKVVIWEGVKFESNSKTALEIKLVDGSYFAENYEVMDFD